MMRSFNLYMLFILQFGFVLPCYAQFSPPWQPEDAKGVDRESTGKEIYGDVRSFQFLPHSRRQWQSKQTGYRVTAGSLDIKKFYFFEEIKFSADPTGDVDFSYRSVRKQDLVEQREERQAKMAFRTFSHLYLSMMGYSDFDKSHGDLGGSIEWRQAVDKQLVFSYLSVDQYFNDKKDEGSDIYRRRPQHFAHEGKWRFSDSYLAWFAAYHSPLRWKRGEQFYIYDFQRREAAFDYFMRIDDHWNMTLNFYYDYKFESKSWYGEEGDESLNVFAKGLDRQVYKVFGETSYNFSAKEYLATSLSAAFRKSDYHYQNPSNFNDDDAPEPIDSDLQRRDVILASQYYDPFKDSKHGLVYGLFLSFPQVYVNSWSQSFEVKPQLAWEYRINDNSFILLNTTYDLDETIAQFPYENGFPGWDGGNAQFQLTF